MNFEENSDYYQLIGKYIKNSNTLMKKKVTHKMTNAKKRKEYSSFCSKKNSAKTHNISTSYEDFLSKILNKYRNSYYPLNSQKTQLKKRKPCNFSNLKMNKSTLTKKAVGSQNKHNRIKIKDKEKFCLIVLQNLHEYPKLNIELKLEGAI